MTPQLPPEFEAIAKQFLGGCTCDFEMGFAWDGSHAKSCSVKALSRLLHSTAQSAREEQIKKDAGIALELVEVIDAYANPIYVWNNAQAIAKAILSQSENKLK